VVKTMNSHLLKIDVMKFDGKNNFGMWRREVMDALTASNLEDTLRLEKKLWLLRNRMDKMNQMVCGLIRSYLTQDIKYHVLYETSARQLWEILDKKYLTKSINSRLQLKMRLYHFQMKRGISIDEHMKG